MRRLARGGARQARGLTLLELLISLTLGLLIIAATFAGYLALSEAARVSETQSRMNEDGQAALAVLAAHLRMAGNNPERRYRIHSTKRNPVYTSPDSVAVRGCDDRFTNITTAASVQDLICASGTPSSPDSIAITYEADRFNTAASALDPTPKDCLGAPLAALTQSFDVVIEPGPTTELQNVSFYVADNRFYIATDPGGSPSLYCRGNGGGTPRPLVENVENLQLSYGVVPATSPDAAAIAGYLDAAEVVSHSDLASLPSDSARWRKVAVVRVCVVVRSQRAVVGAAGSAQYLKCDGTIETNPPDLHLRRAYSTTVVIRNRLGEIE